MATKSVKKSVQGKPVEQKPRPKIGTTGKIIKTLIGESILQARLKKNLTRPQLSDMINMSSKSIQKWEEGESYPDDMSVFLPMEDVLNIKISRILRDALVVARSGDRRATGVIIKARRMRGKEKIRKSKISAKKRKKMAGKK